MQEKEQKISPIKQRILQFADKLGVSKRKFYEEIGVSRGTLEAKTGITEDVLAKFIANFPEVSIDWLLLGKGEMLRNNEQVSNAGTNQFEKNIDTLYYLIDLQKEKIAQLEKELCIEREKVASLSNATNTEHILL